MISTKGRYALRLMLDLAEYQKDSFVSLKDIAERQEISKKYLEQIIPLLTRANMLQTGRGPRGGYRLAAPADSYTVADILRAAEGSLAPVSCLDPASAPCARSETCKTLPLWNGLNKVVNDYLTGITLEDLIGPAEGGDYII